jgi:carbon storage regulator CsrA
MPRLVLSRNVRESIAIGEDILVQVASNKGGRVKLVVDAPSHIKVDRAEKVAKEPVDLANGRRLREGASLSQTIWEPMRAKICRSNMGFRVPVSQHIGSRVVDDDGDTYAKFYNGEGPHDIYGAVFEHRPGVSGVGPELAIFQGAPEYVLKKTLGFMAQWRINKSIESGNELLAFGVDMRAESFA